MLSSFETETLVTMSSIFQASSLTQGKRRVWYKLVSTTNGDAYKGGDVDVVTLSTDASVLDFGDAVYASHSRLFERIGRPQLQVYGTEASFTMRNMNGEKIVPLHPESLIGSFGETHTNPQIVVVPGQISNFSKQQSEPKYILYLKPRVDNDGSDAGSAVDRYMKLGERIRGDHGAMMFINGLLDGFLAGSSNGAFNALCVPSGTGKTQLAFSFPPDKCTTIYLNMGVATTDDMRGSQEIYQAFKDLMGCFGELVREDIEKKFTIFRIYGFFRALIRLLAQHPRLRLPGDLSRLEIRKQLGQAIEGGEPIDAISLSQLEPELNQWSKDNDNKPVIIFIDEFAPKRFMKQEELAFLRRKIMNLKVCLVVASSDSGVMKMFNNEAATQDSRKAPDQPWVNLCTRLPQYVPDLITRDAIDTCTDASVRSVLDLCIQSRPLFASVVDAQIVKNPSYVINNIIPFLEKAREDIVKILRLKGAASSQDGCIGYVIGMLLAGAALISSDSERMLLFGNLTAKNWAYLVGDEEILKVELPDIDGAKRARLQSEGRDSYMEMKIKKEVPTFLLLDRRHLDTCGKDILLITGSTAEFHCRSFFPEPSEDFLFYLALAGSRTHPGLYLLDRIKMHERISVAKVINSVIPMSPNLPQSRNHLMPSYDSHESLVCAAFYAACNAGELSGCSLEDLVTRFVAELLTPKIVSFPNLKPVDKIPLRTPFQSRFVFPFDSSIPSAVHQVLNSVGASRQSTQGCFDAVTFFADNADKKRYEVLLEAKSTIDEENVPRIIRAALERNNSNAKVRFIVVDQYGGKEVRNDERVDCKIVEGKHVNARVFLVNIDSARKVFLDPIDGKPQNETADSVILVIALSMINHRYQD